MVHIGLQDKARGEVCRILNTVLADEFVLSTRTRNYYWNVTGSHFRELRALFGDQYRRLDDLVDRIAERVRALGGNPPGTLVGFVKYTRLIEHPAVHVSAWAMVDRLLEYHKILIRDLREDLERNPELRLDIGTTDFLTAVLQEHEAAAWMLLSLDWKNTSLKSWLNEQEKVTYGRELPGEVLVSTIAEGEMT